MFGYTFRDPRIYERPVTYMTQPRTGLVPRYNPEEDHPVMDMDTVQTMRLLKDQQMRNIVDWGGLDHGILFEDCFIQRLKFKNIRSDCNRQKEYVIRQVKGNHEGLSPLKPYELKQSGSCFACNDFKEFYDELVKICNQKKLIKTLYMHIAGIAQK